MNLKPLGANVNQVTVGLLEILFSYETPVACFNHNTGNAFRTEKFWSNTTTRHINKWFQGRKNVRTQPQQFFDTLAWEVK